MYSISQLKYNASVKTGYYRINCSSNSPSFLCTTRENEAVWRRTVYMTGPSSCFQRTTNTMQLASLTLQQPNKLPPSLTLEVSCYLSTTCMHDTTIHRSLIWGKVTLQCTLDHSHTLEVTTQPIALNWHTWGNDAAHSSQLTHTISHPLLRGICSILSSKCL